MSPACLRRHRILRKKFEAISTASGKDLILVGKNVFEKIMAAHLVSGTAAPGNEVGIRIDQTLTQDALGTMAYLQFEAMGVPAVKTRSVSYIDHNTLQDGFENADDHRYLQTVADKYGILYSKAGNGICHQVHLERFSRPGMTLIGSDSHTPTCGAVGMIAMGVGGMDVAVAMAGGAFYFSYPRVIRVNLTGRLQPWCAAKDIILAMLQRLTTKGNVGTVLEYGGPGLDTLTVPERATIANMGAELGVTTSVFPSDAMTQRFFKAQARLKDWQPLAPDPDAVYDQMIEVDLGTIVPYVACPHSPDNVRTVREVSGLAVDQVLIGSCTNSSYRDLMLAAAILKGKRIHPHVSLGITPGSKQVLAMIAKNGALGDLIAAGARILETTCGFCVGCGQAPQTKAVSVRTNNRNFEGRSGTKDAQVYLVSPETAAATALTGVVTDPRDLNRPYPDIILPQRYRIDDSMIIQPSCDPAIAVYRGPNIGAPPQNTPMPETLQGKVAIKVGDKITTDHIMPAGPFLKYRSNVPKYANYVFYHLDPGFADRCRQNKDNRLASIIVAGLSYGQGSSREHAALCPMYLGVRVLLAKSVERIHAANLINFGILQLTFANEADYDRIDCDDELIIEHMPQAIQQELIMVRNRSKDYQFPVKNSLTPRQREIVSSGGLLNYTGKSSR